MVVTKMTLHKIFTKLKKKNKGNYFQFTLSLTLAILLVSSLMIIVFSPLIQDAFPEGGDSRKMMFLICSMAIVGCLLLVFYAGKLFLRFKSREIGIFLALGTPKSRLANTLFWEMTKITFMCSVVGIVAGSVIAFFAGKIFEFLAGAVVDSEFAFTLQGYAASFVFSLLLCFILLLMSATAMKRTNVIEVINEERRQEPLKVVISKHYLMWGISFLVFGIFMALVLPGILANAFSTVVGTISYVFYFFVLWGLYRIMVYSLSCHSKRRNPQKYYQNLLNYGLMKFQGASVVKNMLVITLLLFGGLFAIFYLPIQNSGTNEALSLYETGFGYRYPLASDELTKEDVFQLAADHGVKITDYREAQFIAVTGSGTERENLDKKGRVIEQYFKNYAQYECIGESEYNRITDSKLSISPGTFYLIKSPGARETIYDKFDNMDALYCKETKDYLPMEYEGVVSYQSLLVRTGSSVNSRFVISDQDYALLRTGLSDHEIMNQVLFNTDESSNIIAFSESFFKAFANGMSEEMDVKGLFDPVVEERNGERSAYRSATLDPDTPVKEADWQYEPVMTDYKKAMSKFTYAIMFLLFIYLFLICLIAVIIISYTRSISVALGNRQVFADVERLGANHAYLRSLLKTQQKKVYVLPTLIGSVGMVGYVMLIYWNNDGILKAYELATLPILLAGAIFVCVVQYIVFRLAFKKSKEILKLG